MEADNPAKPVATKVVAKGGEGPWGDALDGPVPELFPLPLDLLPAKVELLRVREDEIRRLALQLLQQSFRLRVRRLLLRVLVRAVRVGELRLVRALSDEQIAAMRDPRLAATTKLPRIEDAVKAGGFLAGTPADIIEQLKAVEKRYPGLDRVSCSMALGTPLAVALEQLDRFAKEVMPAFRTATAVAAD